MITTDFRLPDLGEGIEEADIVRVLVHEGDTVTADQPVVEIETEKATLEVPAPVAGRVTALHVQSGATVKVGDPLMTIEEAGAPAEPPHPPSPSPSLGNGEGVAAGVAPSPPPTEAGRTEPEGGGAQTQPQDQPIPVTADQVQPAVTEDRATDVPPSPSVTMERGPGGEVVPPPEAAPTPTSQPSDLPVPAAPSVRQFAREVGVDIRAVHGSGPGGRISEDDVKRHAREASMPAAPPTSTPAPAAAPAPAAPRLPDFSQFGPVRREPLSRFRRTVARNMTTSWSQIPHVTLHATADVTELEVVRRQYRERAAQAGGNLTLSVVMLKIVAAALNAFPRFNSSLDVASDELVLKDYFHIGMAVDTERGLAVPAVRDVDRKNLMELAVEVAQIAGRAREGKLTLEEMRGSTFTISNLGSLGTGFFTPLINHPEVAILGIGRAETLPVYEGDALVPRLRLPLSLSIDHRVLDGADGARFLGWILDAINEPLLLALEG